MRKLLFMLLAVAAFVGCGEEIAEEIPQVNDKSRSWKIPADLPNNIEEIIASAPCWVQCELLYSAFVIDGKVVIKDYPGDFLVGDDFFTFKFHQNKQLDCYITDLVDKDRTPRYTKAEWRKIKILEYKDGVLVYAFGDDVTKDNAILTVQFLTIGTQEYLNNLISRIPDSAE